MHEPADRRPLHLDDDLLAGEQRGGVHLGDRRGGERLGVEAAKISSSGAPSSSSTTARTTANGSAGTWSRQRLNSLTSSGGNMPSPEERIWPSLM